MNHLPARLTALTATAAAVALIVSGCSSAGGGGDRSSSGSKTLVVDNTFDLKTSDPARAFELTGSIVDKALYETALTFTGLRRHQAGAAADHATRCPTTTRRSR